MATTNKSDHVAVDKLSILTGNPRRGDVTAVKRSLAQFGQAKPIVARRTTLEVIAGNHTLLAARELGWSKIWVAWFDGTDEEAKAFALADNRTHDLGTYDDDDLAALLATVADTGDASLFAATGYTDTELALLLAGALPEPETFTDPDDVPVPKTARTRPGDLWILGEHRLLCGDATNPADLDKLMTGSLANLILTDPPYGVNYEGGQNPAKRRKLAGDDIDIFATSIPHLAARSTGDAALYLWFAGSLGHYAYDAVRAAGYTVRALLTWHKLNAHYGAYMSQYMPKSEPMLYCFKTGHSPKWRGPTNEVTVWEHPQPAHNELHPTQKPVELLTRAITNSTDPGDIILDPFTGSGSTLIAAHNTGRTAHLLELDPTYCDTTITRWENHTGQKAHQA